MSVPKGLNYDCIFAGGRGRRKYFFHDVYVCFPPVYHADVKQPRLQQAASYTPTNYAVRLHQNRLEGTRRRYAPLNVRNFTVPGSQVSLH
ncbi:Hypp8561 [Branchiostoma lanceolatum]|uniref:Hypp8561 protein n=1 Tax=Branchiostoma lanceolatum TaxID=7740 RepID=A0A8J9Z7I8_BRALA|nr:Hypp8561 [Branchiostoma lanceolatum]